MEYEPAQAGIPHVCKLPHFNVAQILSCAREEVVGVIKRSTAGEAKSDMIFSDHQQCDRPMEAERWDAPGIDGFGRSWHKFLHQPADCLGCGLQLRTTFLDAIIESLAC
jgi:hypothetical protein